METAKLLEAFEEADSAGRLALLQSNPSQPGFSETYFSRVAQLLGEKPSAAKALAEDWAIVRQYGDDPSYAWRVKGALERINGDWLASAKAFIKAGNLAKSPVHQLSFQTGAIDSYARAGRLANAVRLGHTLASQLEAMGERALAGRAWLNTGNANLWADHHKEARKNFERALECLTDSPFKLESASAHLGSSSAALYTDLPSRSLALAERARDDMLALGATAYANHAQANLGQCYLMMGQADEAVRIFSELRDLAEPGSLEYARLGQFLGDAWLALQVYDSALEAFQSAIDSPGIKLSPLNHANCLVGIGEIHLYQGSAGEARITCRKASQLYRKFGNPALDNLALTGVARAEIALNRQNQAGLVLREVITDLRKRRMHQYLVEALLDLSSVSRSPLEVDLVLDEAARLIRRNNFVGDTWRLHATRAAMATTPQDAIREYRKMIDSILIHRAKLSSITARTTLLEPCLRSIRSYLGLLISRNTKASTEEALRVISNLRSVTLLDEFLLANTQTLSDSTRDLLNQIRQEVTADGGSQLPGGPLRLVGRGGGAKPALVRQYLEQVGLERLTSKQTDGKARTNDPVNTFVFLNDRSAWLSSERSLPNGLCRQALGERLRWIYFELMAPLSGFKPDDIRLTRELESLRKDLRLDQLHQDDLHLHLSLEDIAYQIPWTLLTDREPVLHLRPSAGAMPNQTFLGDSPSIAIWYHGRPDLPHIEAEVEQIRALFPRARIFSTREEILKTATDRPFDLIHIAAHGRFDHQNPMFSSIELQDGHLLACDIARSSFRTRIATLASCDSATLGQPSGWEPQGLARAFLARQSEVVIGSLWPLNDKAAEFGFSSFYRKLKRGESVSSSLHGTREALKAEYEHSAYWGPLIMFAGYSL